jgi:hypothetical protein
VYPPPRSESLQASSRSLFSDPVLAKAKSIVDSENSHKFEVPHYSRSNSGTQSKQSYHSEEEKWSQVRNNNNVTNTIMGDQERGQSTSMTSSEKESMQNISVALTEIMADERQINNEIASLNTSFVNCEQSINEYFDVLFIGLKEKQQQMLQLLKQIKHERRVKMENKAMDLGKSHQQILQHKYKCESLLRNANSTYDIQERQNEISILSEKAISEQMVVDSDDEEEKDIESSRSSTMSARKLKQFEEIFMADDDEPGIAVEFNLNAKKSISGRNGFN